MTRYDLHLSSAEFYGLTPAQLFLLLDRHHESLAHREMCHGYTSAAVINSGFCRPEQPVSALDFMPNHKGHGAPVQELTDEQLAAESEYNLRVLRLKLQMEQERDGRSS